MAREETATRVLPNALDAAFRLLDLYADQFLLFFLLKKFPLCDTTMIIADNG